MAFKSARQIRSSLHRLFSTTVTRTRFGLLGIPYNGGTSTKGNGVELAPQLIRQHNVITELTNFNPNIDIQDFGDIEVSDSGEELNASPKNMKNYSGFMPLMNRVNEKIQEIRADNRICITLGGDHAIAVG